MLEDERECITYLSTEFVPSKKGVNGWTAKVKNRREKPTRKTDAKNRREKPTRKTVAVSRRFFASILRIAVYPLVIKLPTSDNRSQIGRRVVHVDVIRFLFVERRADRCVGGSFAVRARAQHR